MIQKEEYRLSLTHPWHEFVLPFVNERKQASRGSSAAEDGTLALRKPRSLPSWKLVRTSTYLTSVLFRLMLRLLAAHATFVGAWIIVFIGSRGRFTFLASPVFTNISVLFSTEIYGICLNSWLLCNLPERGQ